MNPATRRLIQLKFDRHTKAEETLDLLLARKRSGDRKIWLGQKGDQADSRLADQESLHSPGCAAVRVVCGPHRTSRDHQYGCVLGIPDSEGLPLIDHKTGTLIQPPAQRGDPAYTC